MEQPKPKLSVDQQIEHLKSKGVTFDLCPEDEARRYLADKTYYFKVAAYRNLFPKRVGGPRDGEYVNLDFAMLCDLASIDFYLFCSRRWSNALMRSEHYLLRQTKSVRNCCAHSTDLINGFTPNETTTIRMPAEVMAALEELGINRRARRSKMRNPRIQQLVMMAYAYRSLAKGTHSRRLSQQRIAELESRISEHSGWYANMNYLKSTYSFLKKVFDGWL